MIIEEIRISNTRQSITAFRAYLDAIGENEIVEAGFTDSEAAEFCELAYDTATHRSRPAAKAIRHVVMAPDQELTPDQFDAAVSAYRAERNIPADAPMLWSKHTKTRDDGSSVPHYHLAFCEVQGRRVMDSRLRTQTCHKLSRQLEIQFGHEVLGSQYDAYAIDKFEQQGLHDFAAALRDKAPFQFPEPKPTDGTIRAADRLDLDLGKLKTAMKAVADLTGDDRINGVRRILQDHGCRLDYAKARNGKEALMLFHENDPNPIGAFRKAAGLKTRFINEIIPHLDTINKPYEEHTHDRTTDTDHDRRSETGHSRDIEQNDRSTRRDDERRKRRDEQRDTRRVDARSDQQNSGQGVFDRSESGRKRGADRVVDAYDQRPGSSQQSPGRAVDRLDAEVNTFRLFQLRARVHDTALRRGVAALIDQGRGIGRKFERVIQALRLKQPRPVFEHTKTRDTQELLDAVKTLDLSTMRERLDYWDVVDQAADLGIDINNDPHDELFKELDARNAPQPRDLLGDAQLKAAILADLISLERSRAKTNTSERRIEHKARQALAQHVEDHKREAVDRRREASARNELRQLPAPDVKVLIDTVKQVQKTPDARAVVSFKNHLADRSPTFRKALSNAPKRGRGGGSGAPMADLAKPTAGPTVGQVLLDNKDETSRALNAWSASMQANMPRRG